MATMLRSAAMTLLSKTLLTFLYKYLSDVDVEGVEMPSLYGSAEGATSGWGVRLSNVKLREGAELMILPGGRKVKEKPKSDKEPNNDNNSTVSSSKGSKDIRDHERKRRGGKKDVVMENGAGTDTTNRNHEETNGKQNGTRASSDETVDARQQNGSKKETKKGSTADETLLTEGLDSDCGSLASLADIDGTRPETPTQTSSISFLSCFAPNGQDAKATGRMTEQREQDPNLSSETPSQEEREGDSRQYSTKETTNGFHHHNHNYNGDDASINGDGREMDSKELCDAIQKGIDVQLPQIPDLLDEEDNEEEIKEEEGDGTVEDDDNNLPQSPPMALCIGEGGYIGTLDVRLVGRELHVLVEDAFLCLEAVRKEAAPDEPASPKTSAESDNTATDKPPDSPEKQPTPANPPAAPVDIKELKTTGERVLAKNSIARIFSSIPHLFLRDITVRLIVRSDSDNNSENDTSQRSNSQRHPGNNDSSSNAGNADVIVDIGIGLLSVTEGDEFVSPFNEDPDDLSTQDSDMDDEPAPPPPPLVAETSQANQTGPSPENEYLHRRIRTGKGADGGLWLNVVVPKYEKMSNRLFAHNEHHAKVSHAMEQRWARYNWLEETRNCVLRLSGLDIQARIFLGTKKELAQANSSYLWSYDDVSTYQGIDHTLYGFDHVVPGPTPNTLPPLTPAPHCSASRSLDEGDDNGNLRSQVYRTDRNGIQSSQIESCFYRVARGMTPTRCTLEHLPCENCHRCWEVSGKRTCEPVPDETHILDTYTPMPGLALSVSVRDPLEMNVDRLSLDGLGLVIGLFTKEQEPSEAVAGEPSPAAEAELEEPEDIPPVAEVVAESETSVGYFAYFFGSSKSDEGERRFSGLLSHRRSKPKPPAFPKYMKPENIEILGVFVAETRIRVHVMREEDEQRHNTGLSFCYWHLKVDCLTLDQQKLSCEEKSFSDLRLDLGLLVLNEFKGIDKKILVSAGVPCPPMSLESLSSGNRGARPPWPTFASALLDVPATLESLVYENRERHGIQLRMLALTDQPETATAKSRTLINCQLGVLEINLPMKIGGVIGEIQAEAMKSLLGPPKKKEEDPTTEKPGPEEPKKDSITQYRAQLGGGRVRMTPSVDIRLPLTRLAGNICPESGFSMETLLERVELSYGEGSKKLVPTANSAKGVSLKRFPGLPEPIRLRILLFLDDLTPLEQALGLRRQANSFLRCNAVNKGLGKLASKPKKKKTNANSSSTACSNRRQELMNKLLTLDDDALESLWASHLRKQRRVKRTNSNKKAR